jgi:hypothetical protein
MKYSTGIDVSLRSVSICVVDEAGVVQYEGKIPAEVDLIVASLRRLSLDIKQVGLEAGTIFAGVMIGVAFYGLNKLFAHVGLINTWPPILVATLPSLVVLSLAMSALYWIERR